MISKVRMNFNSNNTRMVVNLCTLLLAKNCYSSIDSLASYKFNQSVKGCIFSGENTPFCLIGDSRLMKCAMGEKYGFFVDFGKKSPSRLTSLYSQVLAFTNKLIIEFIEFWENMVIFILNEEKNICLPIFAFAHLPFWLRSNCLD